MEHDICPLRAQSEIMYIISICNMTAALIVGFLKIHVLDSQTQDNLIYRASGLSLLKFLCIYIYFLFSKAVRKRFKKNLLCFLLKGAVNVF